MEKHASNRMMMICFLFYIFFNIVNYMLFREFPLFLSRLISYGLTVKKHIHCLLNCN